MSATILDSIQSHILLVLSDILQKKKCTSQCFIYKEILRTVGMRVSFACFSIQQRYSPTNVKRSVAEFFIIGERFVVITRQLQAAEVLSLRRQL
jgi:hypothetical protein